MKLKELKYTLREIGGVIIGYAVVSFIAFIVLLGLKTFLVG